MLAKRKMPLIGLERRVKARKEDKWVHEPDMSDVDSEDDHDAVSEEDAHGGNSQENDDDDHNSSQGSVSENGSEEEADAAPKVDISSISFGALARAQATLKKQKASKDKEVEETPRDEYVKRYPTKKDTPKVKRSSKHAPQEQSSKRPVSRKREIIPEDGKRAPARDPRFDPLIGARSDDSKMAKNYAFLDEYRDSELAELKLQAKKAKDPSTKEELKRQILSMESKKKARVKKVNEEKLLREHRQKEKEMVAQGKTPFYLKKSEQKKQLLVNQYSSMSKGAIDRAIERKRKKVAGKEKKEMGFLETRVTNRNDRPRKFY